MSKSRIHDLSREDKAASLFTAIAATKDNSNKKTIYKQLQQAYDAYPHIDTTNAAGDTELIFAIKVQNFLAVKWLLKPSKYSSRKKPELNDAEYYLHTKTASGPAALEEAVSFYDDDIEVNEARRTCVTRLIDAGAHVYQGYGYSSPALYAASRFGNLPFIKKYISTKYDFHRANERCIANAIGGKQMAVLDYFFETNTVAWYSIKEKASEIWTAVFQLYQSDLEFAKNIHNKLEQRYPGIFNITCFVISIAISCGCFDLATSLLPKVDLLNPTSESASLIYSAAEKDNYDYVIFLLKKGASATLSSEGKIPQRLLNFLRTYRLVLASDQHHLLLEQLKLLSEKERTDLLDLFATDPEKTKLLLSNYAFFNPASKAVDVVSSSALIQQQLSLPTNQPKLPEAAVHSANLEEMKETPQVVSELLASERKLLKQSHLTHADQLVSLLKLDGFFNDTGHTLAANLHQWLTQTKIPQLQNEPANRLDLKL